MSENPCKLVPRRRWYQFRLRTLLITVTLLCPIFAWAGYSLNWIEKRRAFVQEPGDDRAVYLDQWTFEGKCYAPAGLWLLGEPGCPMMWVKPSRVENAKRLFPEADVREQP